MYETRRKRISTIEVMSQIIYTDPYDKKPPKKYKDKIEITYYTYKGLLRQLKKIIRGEIRKISPYKNLKLKNLNNHGYFLDKLYTELSYIDYVYKNGYKIEFKVVVIEKW